MAGDRVPEVPREPEAFAEILATAAPLLLVGGQAVNLWAMYYSERTADLAPFVSHDVDVLGDRRTLARIASLAGCEPRFFPMRPPTNEVGVVMAKDAQGNTLPVEVLSHVHGIGNDELREWVYTVQIGDSGVSVQIPGPISLLQAKVANVADLSQGNRQDERHVRILAALIPAYLVDLHSTVEHRCLTEKRMLSALERLLAVVTSTSGKTVTDRLGIAPSAMFAELKASRESKVYAFLTKRLPRMFPRGKHES